jgi:hypothetical protein
MSWTDWKKRLENAFKNQPPLGKGKKRNDMKLTEELAKLKNYLDTSNEEGFKKQADLINANFTSEADKKAIDQFMSSKLTELSAQTEKLTQEAQICIQLLDVKEIVSLSYISKKYFNKTRSWLHQKINGNIKNGKPARFTNEEIKTFNFALQDISKKIGSITIHS